MVAVWKKWNRQLCSNLLFNVLFSRFSRCCVNWLNVTCISVRLNTVPNKVAGPYRCRSRAPVSPSRLHFNMFRSRLRFGKCQICAEQKLEFQVDLRCRCCWQDCQLQSVTVKRYSCTCDLLRSFLPDTVNGVWICLIWGPLYLWEGKKTVFVQQVTKIRYSVWNWIRV